MNYYLTDKELIFIKELIEKHESNDEQWNKFIHVDSFFKKWKKEIQSLTFKGWIKIQECELTGLIRHLVNPDLKILFNLYENHSSFLELFKKELVKQFYLTIPDRKYSKFDKLYDEFVSDKMILPWDDEDEDY